VGGGVEQHTFGCVWSPDGAQLAVALEVWAGGGLDGDLKLVNTTTGKEVELQGVSREFLNATFSPDGHRLAAACIDGTIRVWDGSPPRPVLRVESRPEAGAN
jgi:WD40 repeat protein